MIDTKVKAGYGTIACTCVNQVLTVDNDVSASDNRNDAVDVPDTGVLQTRRSWCRGQVRNEWCRCHADR
jgi:hypothetical protein